MKYDKEIKQLLNIFPNSNIFEFKNTIYMHGNEYIIIEKENGKWSAGVLVSDDKKVIEIDWYSAEYYNFNELIKLLQEVVND
jgi:hypothetical protein